MKRLVFLLYIIVYSICAMGQFIPADEIFYRTSRQSILCPPEKVYLHTDRNTYVAGDTIWMRAHVVDGIAHVPMKLSAYVYVILQNPFLERIAQVRLKADKDGYIYGYIPLLEDLPKGEYSLCAYTQYMKNFDNEYFFKKQIVVNSVLNRSIRLQTSRRGRNLDVQFINSVTGEKEEIKNVTIKVPSGEIDAQRHDSSYSIKIHNVEEKVLLVQAGNYKEFVNIDVRPDYDVSFLPEGGNLVAGVFNRVAFKCINSLGQGENIIGTLRDEKDSILISFKSLYRGMGTVSFIPEKGEKYTAVCEDMNGVQKRFPLPEATDKYTMQVNQIRDKIFVKVLFPSSTENKEKLLIFAHQRGWPVKIGGWQKNTPGLVCNQEDFTEGPASFLLVNETGQIVSERMIFIRKDNRLKGKMNVSNSQLGKREKLILQIQMSEKWWNGNCSVSITDNHDIRPDSCTNILSSLLLSSDLRGYIESPAWYFQEDPNDSLELRRRALDALMMTQGWRKYDMRKVWSKIYKEPDLLPERSMQITGKVTTRITNKPVRKAKVRLIIPSMGVREEIQTEKDGIFHFENFDAPDSTYFWFDAYTERGNDRVVLELDTVIHPALERRIPPICWNNGQMGQNISSEYLAKTELRIMHDKGIRHMFLDELVITAPNIAQETEYEKLIGSASIKEERINESGIEDLLTFLKQQYPSINWIDKDGSVTLTLRGEPVTVILDGSICRPYDTGSQDFLRTYLLIDVEQIDIIKSPYSLSYDPLASGGIVAITTKTGYKSSAKWYSTNTKKIQLLGYQKPVEFYSPRYELTIDKERNGSDFRTTLLWEPRLTVKNGNAEIEFYTADTPVNYSVVIEGVGEDGSIFRMEEQIVGY